MNIIPQEIMSDLYIRFQEDLNDFKNIFSNIEMMYWFYLDQFFVMGNLPNVDLIDFATQFFDQFKSKIPEGFIWEVEFDLWKSKKCKNPRSSVIIMDSKFEMVLMVKGFSSKRWTFPGGKKETESFKECAIREIDEEIGFDISRKIDDNLCIKSESFGVKRYNYIICGIPLNTKFRPKTNFEIEKITWFPLIHLPESKHDNCLTALNAHAKDFQSCTYIIKILKKWVGLLRSHNINEALNIAIGLVDELEPWPKKSNSKNISDSKDANVISQESALMMTKNRMYSFPKKENKSSVKSLWLGLQFNGDEFTNAFFQQLHCQ